MLFRLVFIAWILLGCSAPCLAIDPADEHVAERAERSSVLLLPGTRWETPVYEIRSGEAGPTVLIIAGVHGNEPAGAHAAERMLDWTPARGRLVIVPRANAPALEAGTRRTPGLPRAESDLNRQFPMTNEQTPTGELAGALWSLVCEVRPDLVLDLHEGYHFTQIEPKSVGSSVIADRREETKALARVMLGALNPSIEYPLRKFVLKSPMVRGSLARGASELLRIPSMILETTTRNQPIELRADQHLTLVRAALSELGVLGAGEPGSAPAPREHAEP